MGFLTTQFYDDFITIEPVRKPFYIQSGSSYPAFEAFVFKRQGQFGNNLPPEDISNYSFVIMLYNQSNQLVVQGDMIISDPTTGKIKYIFEAYETFNSGAFKAYIQVNYLKEAVSGVLSTATFTIDFVSSYSVAKTYEVSQFAILVGSVNLLQDQQVVIHIGDTIQTTTEQISNLINAGTTSHGFTSVYLNNIITLTAPVDSYSEFNDNVINFVSDDTIVSLNSKCFEGGVDPIASESFNLMYPSDANYFRVFIK